MNHRKNSDLEPSQANAFMLIWNMSIHNQRGFTLGETHIVSETFNPGLTLFSNLSLKA